MDAEADPHFPTDPAPGLRDFAQCLHAACGDRTAATLAAVTAGLFMRHLRFDAADTSWPDRDRLMLGGMATALADRLTALLGAAPGLTDIFAQAPGQSLGAAMGAALAERMLAQRFGRSLVDHRIWLLLDSQELATGAAQEAAILAGSLQLGRLTVVAAANDQDWAALGRFTALGWTLRRIDADDAEAASSALSAAMRSRKPTLIACRATASPGQAPDLARVEADWSTIGHRGAGARRAWLKRLKRHTNRDTFERAMGGTLPHGWQASLAGVELAGSGTAQPVDAALSRLAHVMPGLSPMPAEHQGLPWAGYAQAAGGALVGMAVHGGIFPIGKKSLAESEALRPALRLAAVLGLRLVHVLIEPEIPCPAGGLRAALRAMDNVFVFRPAHAEEALVCLELALRRAAGPTVLMLTETRLPGAADGFGARSCVRGGYVVAEPGRQRDMTIIVGGPELALALEAAMQLAAEGVAAAVVALPCWDLFAVQDPAYRHMVLGDAPRLGVEAGGGFGWDRHLGANGMFIGAAEGSLTVARVMAAARQLT